MFVNVVIGVRFLHLHPRALSDAHSRQPPTSRHNSFSAPTLGHCSLKDTLTTPRSTPKTHTLYCLY
jgi:hypothetical protein